ncbi:MAG: MFS transporter [Planctomycetota bacterium]
MTALIPVLTERLSLASWHETAIYMITPLFAGGCQPVFARLTDKYDIQLCGPLGLAITALTLASIGFAESFAQLVVLQVIGVIASGMYHPVTTATAGALGAGILRNGRAQAIGLFIAAGMAGQTVGPIIASRVNRVFGMEHLAWLIAPSLVLALVLHVMVRGVPHRRTRVDDESPVFDRHESHRRWWYVAMLAAQNVLRFITQSGMFLMFNLWAESAVRRDERSLAIAASSETPDLVLGGLASSYSANLLAAMTAGMCVSVLSMGRLVRRGRERAPLIVCTVIGVVTIAVMGWVGDASVAAFGLGTWTLMPVYMCAFVAPVGFFGTFAVVTSLAQRLHPDHTSLVTSLNMGVGWMISAIAPVLAIGFFGWVSLENAPMLSPDRLNLGFVGFAVVLALAGIVVAMIPRRAFSIAAEAH